MKRLRLLIPLLLILVLALAPLSASAAEDLTITAGAGASWKPGGYDFHGTSSATKASFRPFEGANIITVVVWFKVTSVAAVNMIFSQREAAGAQLRIYTDTNGKIVSQVCSTQTETTTSVASIAVNKLQMVVVAWNKDANSGKPDQYLNTTKAEGATGITTTGDADIDMVIGAANDGTSKANSTIYFLGIDNVKWDQAKVNTAFALGSEVMPESLYLYYWTFNENTGTTLHDGDDSWYQVEDWVVDLPAKIQSWHDVETWFVLVFIHAWFPAVTHDPMFFIFVGGILSSTGSITMTLLKLRSHDPNGTSLWIVFSIVSLCVMLGALL